MDKSNKLALGFTLGAAGITMASRLIPHIPNFTAMQSLTLFAGAYLGYRLLAVLVPLLTWYVSDLVINNTIARSYFPETDGMVWYGDYMISIGIAAIAIALIGAFGLKKWSAPKLALTSVGCTLLFFLITNFGSWLGNPIYPQDATGLMASYTAGLPFLGTSLVSNLVYAAVLFGGFELLHRYVYKSAAQMS